jgi:putative membrane protein
MILYSSIFIWSAISPKNYAVWFLEILGVFFLISIYVFYNKDIQFTSLTNTWFFIAMALITIGAHYSFPDVPIFEDLKGWNGMQRNNFDKLGHLVQGVLPVLISREVLFKKGIVKDFYWNSFLAFCVAMSITAGYELVEWLFILVLGDNDYTFDVMGTQGYIWDAQSDMLMASIGAILTILLSRKHFLHIQSH